MPKSPPATFSSDANLYFGIRWSGRKTVLVSTGTTVHFVPMRFLFVFFVFLAEHCPLSSALPVGALPALQVDSTVRLAAGDGKGILPPDETAVPVPLVARPSTEASSTGETQNAPPTRANRALSWSLFHPHSQRRHSACGPDGCALFFLRYFSLHPFAA